MDTVYFLRMVDEVIDPLRNHKSKQTRICTEPKEREWNGQSERNRKVLRLVLLQLMKQISPPPLFGTVSKTTSLNTKLELRGDGFAT